MNIALETINVWQIDGDFDATALFKALPHICTPTDLLVVGCYHPAEQVLQWLLANELPLPEGRKPFGDSFDLNREEYPMGKAYAIHPGKAQLEELSRFASLKNGGVEIDLFFDHLIVYRPAEPVLPLLDYHDAFRGDLHLSGHYPEEVARAVAKSLGAKASLIINPAIRTLLRDDTI